MAAGDEVQASTDMRWAALQQRGQRLHREDGGDDTVHDVEALFLARAPLGRHLRLGDVDQEAQANEAAHAHLEPVVAKQHARLGAPHGQGAVSCPPHLDG